MLELHELETGLRVRGLVAAGEVTIVAVEPHGDGIINVVFRGDDGHIADRLLETSQLGSIEVAEGRRWTCDADGAKFKLAPAPDRGRLRPSSAVAAAQVLARR